MCIDNRLLPSTASRAKTASFVDFISSLSVRVGDLPEANGDASLEAADTTVVGTIRGRRIVLVAERQCSKPELRLRAAF